MDEVLIRIDERDFANGRPDAPFLMIRSHTRAGERVVSAQANEAAIESHSGKLLDFGVTSISLSVNGLRRLTTCMTNLETMTELAISSSDVSEDLAVVALFTQLESLKVYPQPPLQPIAEIAPQIRFLTLNKLNKTSLANLANLEGLELMSGPRQIESLQSKRLNKLFLGSFTEGQGSLLPQFSELKTLLIRTRKSNLSFSFLSHFSALENFAFEGPADQNWLELPPGLKKVTIEKTTNSLAVGKHLENSNVVSIGFNPKIRDDEGFYHGDLLLEGDPFRELRDDVISEDLGY